MQQIFTIHLSLHGVRQGLVLFHILFVTVYYSCETFKSIMKGIFEIDPIKCLSDHVYQFFPYFKRNFVKYHQVM